MTKVDLIVVGAGIVGTFAAYHARTRFPSWTILLIDRAFAGDGATRYSGGLNHPFGWSDAQAALSRESLEMFERVREHIPSFPISTNPLFGVASEEHADSILHRFTRPGARLGTPEDTIQLRATYPTLAIPQGKVIIAGCVGGYGDPRGAVEVMIQWLRACPRTQCWEGVEVVDVSPLELAHRITTSDARHVLADHVIIAAGPWMVRGVGRHAMRRSGIRIKKIVAFHIDKRPKKSDATIFFFDEDSYLLPNCYQRRWIFSFPATEWNCRPESSELRISSEDREDASKILRKYCPSLENCINDGRVFCDAYSSDRLPIVSNAMGSAHCIVAGACSGFGFRLAPAIARIALDAVLDVPR